MALTPVLQVQVVEDYLEITDQTVYGAPEYERSEVQVDFALELNRSTGTVNIGTPDYDPELVASINAVVPDGFYRVTMTVTPNDESDPISTNALAFIHSELDDCLIGYRDKLFCKCCKDFDKAVLKYNKLKVTIDVIDELVEQLKYSDAQCLLERVSGMCEGKKPCGC